MATLQAEIEGLKIGGLTRKFTKAMHQDRWPCLHSGDVPIKIKSMPKRCSEHRISLRIGLLTTSLHGKKKHCKADFSKRKVDAQRSGMLGYWYCSQDLCSLILSLYCNLIFLNFTFGDLSFWEGLWIVGITLHFEIFFHRLNKLYSIGAFFHSSLKI